MEKEIGKVTHWYDKIGVAVLKLSAPLSVGDRIKVVRGEHVSEDTVSSMQLDHADVSKGGKGDEVAVKLKDRAAEGAVVYKIE